MEKTDGQTGEQTNPNYSMIPDVLVTNIITKLYESCLVVMASQTILTGMKFTITGTHNSHEVFKEGKVDS